MSDRQNLPPDATTRSRPFRPPRRRSRQAAPDNRLRKQDGTFAKGVSGNPGGRPNGCRGVLARALDELAAADAGAVLGKTIAMAKQGDIAAARLIMRRAWPVPKGRPVEGLVLPRLDSLSDTVTAMAAITGALSAGTISTDEARDLTEILDAFRKIHELVDIERRVVILERERAAWPGNESERERREA